MMSMACSMVQMMLSVLKDVGFKGSGDRDTPRSFARVAEVAEITDCLVHRLAHVAVRACVCIYDEGAAAHMARERF